MKTIGQHNISCYCKRLIDAAPQNVSLVYVMFSTPKKVKAKCLMSIVKRIRPDRPVGPVQLGTGPQAILIFTIKSDAVKTDQELGKIGEPVWTEPVKPVDWFGFFFLILVKMLLFLLCKKEEEEAQSEQKFISFITLILLVCLFAIYS